MRLAVLLVLLLATVAVAAEVTLPETDLLRLRLLATERALIVERFQKLKAQADFEHAQKHAELNAFLQSLRDREGFDATWSPDPKTGVWTEAK